jgi:sugar phosphate isomerase/epimerase
VTGTWDLWRSSPTAVQRRMVLPPGNTTLPAAIEQARRFPSVQNLTLVMLLPEERATLDDYRRLADAMNRAGEMCHTAGLTLSYHSHAYEFEPKGGTTGFAVLYERFDRNLVRFELDVLWMAVSGLDPVEFIRANRGRITGLHLKDIAVDAPKPFYGSPWDMPAGVRVPVGDGITDFRTLLQSAREALVTHAYVEDESDGDRFQNVLKSLRHLKTIAI